MKPLAINLAIYLSFELEVKRNLSWRPTTGKWNLVASIVAKMSVVEDEEPLRDPMLAEIRDSQFAMNSLINRVARQGKV